MPLLLIAAVWIAILALFVAVCQTAARGDQRPAEVLEASEYRSGLNTLQRHAADTIRVRRPHRLPLRDGARTRRDRVAHLAR